MNSAKPAALGSIVVLLVIAVLLWAPWNRQGVAEGEQLILYCAAGMLRPVEKIADQYEREYGVRILIEPDGSGKLLAKIKGAPNRGELYLAADPSYIIEARQLRLVAESVPVAQMRPVLVVNSKTQQQLEKDLAGSQERYRLTKTELDYLVAKHADEIMAFEKEKALLVENLQALELLKGQYGDLEVAYNRLVRPARNMVGRHVVRVRYWKESGYFHYSLQEPDQVVETEVSEDELHEHLSQLKAAHPGNLFTHVLFPGGKDLSHEEAYLFERSIVSRYDYYESD